MRFYNGKDPPKTREAEGPVFYRGTWTLIDKNKDPFTVAWSPSRSRIFARAGLDMRKYPKPQMRGLEYPAYMGDRIIIAPSPDPDGEIMAYCIKLSENASF